MIKWFNVKARNGVATLYDNNITLNTTAMDPFEIAYKVQVGFQAHLAFVPEHLSIIKSSIC